MDSSSFTNQFRQSEKRTLCESNVDRKRAKPTQNVIRDCFGNEYRRLPMRGNGFCGFNSLSYSLTGNQESYEDIISDCANVFVNVPDLFRMRTNFGSRLNSSLTVNDYVNFMRSSVDRVRRGLSVDSDAWCEDAHFAAIAVLYDIAIFNYSTTAE